jgi:hypothetical protein
MKAPSYSMAQTWELSLEKMARKTHLCQADNKFVFLEPLQPMANSLPAQKKARFGRFEPASHDKTADQKRSKTNFKRPRNSDGTRHSFAFN